MGYCQWGTVNGVLPIEKAIKLMTSGLNRLTSLLNLLLPSWKVLLVSLGLGFCFGLPLHIFVFLFQPHDFIKICSPPLNTGIVGHFFLIIRNECFWCGSTLNVHAETSVFFR